MKGYITKLGNYIYFAEVNIQPSYESFIIQGKVKAVYFYTFDDTPTLKWMGSNPFGRKRKIDLYSRPIRLTNNPDLNLPNFTSSQLEKALKYIEKPNEIIEL